jgi:hypothetical protein
LITKKRMPERVSLSNDDSCNGECRQLSSITVKERNRPATHIPPTTLGAVTWLCTPSHAEHR